MLLILLAFLAARTYTCEQSVPGVNAVCTLSSIARAADVNHNGLVAENGGGKPDLKHWLRRWVLVQPIFLNVASAAIQQRVRSGRLLTASTPVCSMAFASCGA